MDSHIEDEETPFYLQMSQPKRYMPLSVADEDGDSFLKRQKQYGQYNYGDPQQQQQDLGLSQQDSLHVQQHVQSPYSYNAMNMQSQGMLTSPYSAGSNNSFQSSSNFSFPFPPPSQNILPPPQQNSSQQPTLDYRYQSMTSSPNTSSSSSSSSSQPPLLPVYYFTSPPYLPRPSSSYPQITTLHQPEMRQQYSLQSSMGQHMQHGFEDPLEAHLGQPLYKLSQSNPLSTLANVSQSGGRKPKASASSGPKPEVVRKKEGLEESAARIISLLQTKGKMIFKDIHETLSIDYRRAYDILNILLTTTLITKMGKKRENKLPFVYQDGNPLPEPVELRDIMGDIQREEDLISLSRQRISLLEEELVKDEPNPKIFAMLKERDPSTMVDPIYKDLI